MEPFAAKGIGPAPARTPLDEDAKVVAASRSSTPSSTGWPVRTWSMSPRARAGEPQPVSATPSAATRA